MGFNPLTTQQDENIGEYISLQKATKYCNYSQEYLSLRARQGKLKAVKFGRNWVTKEEWLKEYLEKVEEYNNNKNHFQKFVSPPKNLPIEKTPVLRFGFVTALVFVLLVAGCVFGKTSFQNVFETANPYVIEISQASDLAAKEIFEDTKSSYAQIPPLVQEFNKGFNKGMAEIFKNISPYAYLIGGAGDIIVGNTIEVLAEAIFDIPQSFAPVSLTTASIGDTFKEYGQWLTVNITKWFSSQIKEIVQNYLTANDFIEKKISQGWKAITGFLKRPEKIVEEKLIPKPAEEGVVIIPSTEKDEEVKEKIKESFSDEVKVEPKDKTSGIITPIFKEGEGQKYLYILVPVKSE